MLGRISLLKIISTLVPHLHIQSNLNSKMYLTMISDASSLILLNIQVSGQVWKLNSFKL